MHDRQIIRTLLIHFVLKEKGVLQRNRAWLHQEITTPAIVDDYYPDDPHSGGEPISYATLLRVLGGQQAPRGRTRDVLIAFLEGKNLASRAMLDDMSIFPYPQTLGARMSWSHCDESDDNIEGGYIAYAPNDDGISAYFMQLWQQNESPRHLVYVLERDYERRPVEETRTEIFERRIDNGHYDRLTKLGGYRKRSGATHHIMLRKSNGKRFTGMTRATLSVDTSDPPSEILASFDTSNTKVEFKLAHSKSTKIISSLTTRDLNNMMKEIYRFTKKAKFEKDYFILMDELSEADRSLHAAARDSLPLEMIRALLAGANVNAQDPETGKTALHFVGQATEFVGFGVLRHDERIHAMLIHMVKEEGSMDPIEADRAILEAQAKLDPLIVDNNYLFASECCGAPENPFEPIDDPVLKLRLELSDYISNIEYWALVERGLNHALNDRDLCGIEDRIRELGLPPISETPENAL